MYHNHEMPFSLVSHGKYLLFSAIHVALFVVTKQNELAVCKSLGLDKKNVSVLVFENFMKSWS